MRTLLLLLLTAVTAAESAAANDSCYESAVIGSVLSADNFVGLDELGYGGTDDIVLGGRLELAVDVARVIDGRPIQASKIVVQAIMTSQPRNGAELVFYVRRKPSGVYQAVDWRFADEETGSRYSMCAP